MPLRLRPVTLADRPAMQAICDSIWDGEDYLPRVFADWVAHPTGQFVAGEVEGVLAALAKLTCFAPGEYWLEGFRTHPAYRGQRLAVRLCEHLVGVWRQQPERGALRILTGTPPMLKICDQLGFQKLFGFTFVGAAALDQPHRFKPVALTETERAWEMVRQAPLYRAWHGLCETGWRLRCLTPAFFAERLAAGAVYQWNNWTGVWLTLDYHDVPHDGEVCGTQFVAVAPEQQPSLLADLRGLAYALGKQRVRWLPPPDPAELAALAAVGYERLWDEVEFCFELR